MTQYLGKCLGGQFVNRVPVLALESGFFLKGWLVELHQEVMKTPNVGGGGDGIYAENKAKSLAYGVVNRAGLYVWLVRESCQGCAFRSPNR